MTGAMILFGSSLFFVYAPAKTGPGSAVALRWPRPLLMASAASVLGACALGFLAQTAVLAGSLQDALQPDALGAATGMGFGRSSIARALVAALFLVTFPLLRSPRAAWWHAALVGGLVCASFAWMGHGAATKGTIMLVHLASDILHTLAAGVWIGALIAFLLLLITDHRHGETERRALHSALHGFSGVGSALVAVLVATGLINGWFVVGLVGLPRMLTTPYGQLLTVKLLLFLVMLGLAAANRFHLTPRLEAVLNSPPDTPRAIAALRGSLVWETAISIAVLGLVAWFGALAPPGAM